MLKICRILFLSNPALFPIFTPSLNEAIPLHREIASSLVCATVQASLRRYDQFPFSTVRNRVIS